MGDGWAIRVSGLGKEYARGAARARSDNFRESLGAVLRGMLSGGAAGGGEKFWALRGLDFEVAPGDTVGVVGRNGAGKSTLLKILSRITEPTEGEVRYRGRMASLLEVGTGFHRELTGRENIFLNGSILGMRRAEIARQLDAIVDFAGVEKFLDTPVKHYSSGMYVRLAFAVAAHLETDILVVDEVLAVGDAAFQRKCLGKMQSVATDGRTILFVSHNMPAVQRLCRTCLFLQEGALKAYGPTEEILPIYLETGGAAAEMPDRGPNPAKRMWLRRARVADAAGRTALHLHRGEPARLEIAYDVNAPIENVHVVCLLTDRDNNTILCTGDCDAGGSIEERRDPGAYEAAFELPTSVLNDGAYSATFSLGVPFGQIEDRVASCVDFEIVDRRGDGGPAYLQRRPGYLAMDIPWQTKRNAP